MILWFLDHLETERSCGARNLRLTAIRSFVRYASVRDPASLPVAQRVLAIASKRFDRPVLEFLSRDEMQALLDAPDRATWSGQPDAALFAVLYNTGARVSEIIRLRVADILLDRAHAVHLHGKGRKERVIPLWKSTIAQLRAWFERIDRRPEAPVFPQSRRQTDVTFRCRAAPSGNDRQSVVPVSIAPRPSDLAPYRAPRDRDASAAVRCRHHGHCNVARS